MSLLRDQRRLLFFVIGTVTVSLLVVLLWCFSLYRGEVTLPDDALREKLVAFYEEETLFSVLAGGEEPCYPRVVALILLGKARERSVDITAWLVTSGTPHEQGMVRCASERRPSQFPVNRRCCVTLLDYAPASQPLQAGPRRGLYLRASGLRKGGSIMFLYEAFPVTHSRTVMQSFWAGETCLFYVEGDREFVAEPGMTVAEFAAQNNGSFLVLTVKME